MPTASVTGLSAITTSQAAKVPKPPSTAENGTDVPRTLKFSFGIHSRSLSGYFRLSWITAAWAIVNESIAPNEYIVARNLAWPGIRVMIARTANRMIAMYGVR